MAKSRKLSPSGVEQAIAALKRFKTLIDAARVDVVFVAATAAVREAKDGPAFVARVAAETGLAVRVLSGTEEARLSALGVTAGLPEADGVVGDLGGSSLELIRLRPGGEPGEGLTLPLGPLALGAPAPFDQGKTRDRIEKVLAQAEGFQARFGGANQRDHLALGRAIFMHRLVTFGDFLE